MAEPADVSCLHMRTWDPVPWVVAAVEAVLGHDRFRGAPLARIARTSRERRGWRVVVEVGYAMLAYGLVGWLSGRYKVPSKVLH
jgi:hypothetical protein